MSETLSISITSSISSSLSTASCYTDNNLEALCIAVNSLRNEVQALMINKAINELQIPSEIIEPVIEDITKEKFKLGRPPLISEIQDAITKTKSMRGAAEYLGISISTLKRYCLLYENNSGGGGTTPLRLWQPTRGTKVLKSTLP